MMKLKNFLWVLVMMVMASPALAAEVVNLVDVPVPITLEGKTLSKDQVKKAIITGGSSRTWVMVNHPEKKDTLIASVLVRGKHYVEVEIAYSATAYSITYRNSREMKYNEKKQTIHKNYNNWVGLLSNSIQTELSRL